MLVCFDQYLLTALERWHHFRRDMNLHFKRLFSLIDVCHVNRSISQFGLLPRSLLFWLGIAHKKAACRNPTIAGTTEIRKHLITFKNQVIFLSQADHLETVYSGDLCDGHS
jgi:hypothetical protein